MEQILANLLSNAIKYSPNGGPIELRARFREPDRLRIEVQDHGLGFGSAEKAQLFQKFYRVENKEHVSIRGTGLGLSITKYLVEQHEGEIGADSVPGEGSCFWLEIPIFASKGGE
jgi:signal transduction histidine kinase